MADFNQSVGQSRLLAAGGSDAGGRKAQLQATLAQIDAEAGVVLDRLRGFDEWLASAVSAVTAAGQDATVLSALRTSVQSDRSTTVSAVASARSAAVSAINSVNTADTGPTLEAEIAAALQALQAYIAAVTAGWGRNGGLPFGFAPWRPDPLFQFLPAPAPDIIRKNVKP